MLYTTARAPSRLEVLVVILVVWWIVPPALQASAAAEEQHQEAAGSPTEPAYVEPLTEPLAVIPPGREDLLAEMLGRGATLPGQCTFTSGQIDREIVTATYACPTGAVVVTLRHPDKATSDAKLTEQFAIGVQSGSPPAALVDDLASRIRSRERDFEWTWLAASASRQSPRMAVVIIAVLLAGGALWLVLRQRRGKGP